MTARPATICECGDHAFAAITHGLTVLVSPEDAHLLQQRSWQYWRPRKDKRYFTVRSRSGDGNGTITLGAAIVRPPAGSLADHKSGDTLDNRRPNLRVATKSQNALNRKRRLRKYDLPKGVFYAQNNPARFEAMIRLDGRRMYLGRFDTAEQASAAYETKAAELFGDFARKA